jgi:CRP/FNR family cyclic AMP-dependent transcriptional regulator
MIDTDTVGSPEYRSVCLYDVDDDFARAIPEKDRRLGRRALTLPEVVADSGEPISCEESDVLGLLVVDGTLWRELQVGRGSAPQLLDRGAVLLCEPPPGDLLAPTANTVALTPTSLAVLDRRFLLAATRWPGVLSVIHERLAEQQRDLGVQIAIAHLPRVDERVKLLLWHLAERWGRMTGDGIVVPLTLSHRLLGELVGARRPTVSAALAALAS